jgi:hypothetical protein
MRAGLLSTLLFCIQIRCISNYQFHHLGIPSVCLSAQAFDCISLKSRGQLSMSSWPLMSNGCSHDGCDPLYHRSFWCLCVCIILVQGTRHVEIIFLCKMSSGYCFLTVRSLCPCFLKLFRIVNSQYHDWLFPLLLDMQQRLRPQIFVKIFALSFEQIILLSTHLLGLMKSVGSNGT